MAAPWEKYQTTEQEQGPWQRYAGKKTTPVPNPRELDYDRLKYGPTQGMGTVERVMAGYGGAVPSAVREVKRMTGQMGDEEYGEARALDAPLEATTGGQVGSFLGNAAMTVPLSRLPKASTPMGGALIGGGFGAVQPAESSGQRVLNMLTGAAVGGGVNAATRATVPLSRVGRSPDPLLDEMLDAGYRVTPTQAKAGTVARTAEGLASSAKLEKGLSVSNQQNTNRLVRQELGLPDGRISSQQLEKIRSQAGKAYEAVKGSVKIIKVDKDGQFLNDLRALRGDWAQAAAEYPEIVQNEGVEKLIRSLQRPASPRAMVELTRKLRSDAADNLKAFDDPGKRELGFAQRKAALALENAIDRALTSMGKGGLVTDWRNARQLMAKTYDVEAALDDVTGDVSTRYFARLMAKGEPLTGNLSTVAKFGRAYEGSARDVSKMRDIAESGYADLLLGGGTALATGNPYTLLLTGARPALRGLMRSPITQRAFKRPQELPLSDLRNIDSVSRAALPLSLGGMSVRKQEDENQ